MLTVLSKDARLWSFWGRGWLCVPVVIGWSSGSRGLVCGRLGHELEERLPGVISSYGRFCKSNYHDCVVYSVSKDKNVWRARFHDHKLPSSDMMTGVILCPTRSLDTRDPAASWQHDPSWERVKNTLTNIKKFVRPALHGEIYLPMLGLCDNDDLESIKEDIEEELTDSRGFTLLIGEDDKMVAPKDVSSQLYPTDSSSVITNDTVLPVSPANNAAVSKISDDFETIIPRRRT